MGEVELTTPRHEEILAELTTLSHFLGDPVHDLAILGEGNTSARVEEDLFYVKASGQNLGSITPQGFCAVRFSRILPSFEGADLTDAQVKQTLMESKLDASDIMPSVETFFHAYLLTLPGIQVIAHTHPVAVNSLLCSQHGRDAFTGRLFPDEIVVCGIAPCYVEYTDPGIPLSRLIKRRVEEHFEAWGEWPKTILMQNHGLIAVGRSVRDAQAITQMAVKTARILLGTYAFGGPQFLTPENVARIHTRPDEHYRQRIVSQPRDA